MNKIIKKLFPDLSKEDFKTLVRKEINTMYAEAGDNIETIQYVSPEETNKYSNVKYDPIGNPYIIIK